MKWLQSHPKLWLALAVLAFVVVLLFFGWRRAVAEVKRANDARLAAEERERLALEAAARERELRIKHDELRKKLMADLRAIEEERLARREAARAAERAVVEIAAEKGTSADTLNAWAESQRGEHRGDSD